MRARRLRVHRTAYCHALSHALRLHRPAEGTTFLQRYQSGRAGAVLTPSSRLPPRVRDGPCPACTASLASAGGAPGVRARARRGAGAHQQVVTEVALGGDGYRVVRQCALQVNLSGGDSGLAAIRFREGPQGGARPGRRSTGLGLVRVCILLPAWLLTSSGCHLCVCAPLLLDLAHALCGCCQEDPPRLSAFAHSTRHMEISSMWDVAAVLMPASAQEPPV